MNTFKIVVGDWSQDGHEKYQFVHFKTNLTAQEVREAYLAGVKKVGIGLHPPEDGESHDVVLAEYGDDHVDVPTADRLKAAGVDLDKTGAFRGECYRSGGRALEAYSFTPDNVAALFLELAKVARPDMQYELVDDVVECVNGYYREGFNMNLGYGVFR